MTHNTTTSRTGTTDTGNLDALARCAPGTDDLLTLAEWLATNGPAHLSAIERIELAERLITRRRFIIGAGGLLGAAALGACGAGEQEAAAPTATTVATRIANHIYGDVELPTNPQRMVATVLPFVTDHALVLGLPLVGGTGASGNAQAPFPEYQQERHPNEMEGLKKIQGRPEMNFEQIAALNPDCILAPEPGEDIYERLSGIAPTFVFPYTYEAEVGGETVQQFDWKQALREIAEAFGRQQQAEEFLSDYQTRAEDLGTRLTERWGDATFAMIYPSEQLSVSGYAMQTDALILFGDLGLTPAPFMTPSAQTFSLEEIPRLEGADVLMVSVNPRADEGSLGRDREAAAPVLESPLWQQLPAVQNDRVFEVSQEITFVSPLAADAYLDYVEQTLLG